MTNIYEQDLDRNPANHIPLSPLPLIERSASVFPNRPSVIHGSRRYTWFETWSRARKLGSALSSRGLGKGDTVAVMLPNIPEMFECHFGIPMTGAVINALNTRLDATTIAFILNHGEANVLITDREFSPTISVALSELDREITVIDVDDPEYIGDGKRLGNQTYEELLAEGEPFYEGRDPDDEWDAISLNYTSGTTGNPKGVVYSHRGPYLGAVGNPLTWSMPQNPTYLWTLPMFHCNGWTFPWVLAALTGTSVCLRNVTAANIFGAIAEEGVTHFCGAPVVLGLVINAEEAERRAFDHSVEIMTAAAPPPPAVLERIESMGFRVTHVYGLTETYGPSTICAWHPEWDALEPVARAKVKSRQGVRYPIAEGLMVADPNTLEPVPQDGDTMGEVFFRGNLVMKGYLKNPTATEEAFRGGWFHSGDLGVWHPDGYIELRDRSKDIIISGGENISTIEVEGVIFGHPKVLEAAVVARPDEKWGETPCAFVTLKPGESATADEIIQYCRDNLAHFKIPRTVVFTDLPKTSTGKIQKFKLRDQAAAL
ncbi:MAG: acyl-CoA synthetase [Rhodospirillaceae bacterium]|nr:acyl-CoA synthetase [Rhodospirillaceae bacterium]